MVGHPVEVILQNPLFTLLPAHWGVLETTSGSQDGKLNAGDSVFPHGLHRGLLLAKCKPQCLCFPQTVTRQGEADQSSTTQNHCCWTLEGIHQRFWRPRKNSRLSSKEWRGPSNYLTNGKTNILMKFSLWKMEWWRHTPRNAKSFFCRCLWVKGWLRKSFP